MRPECTFLKITEKHPLFSEDNDESTALLAIVHFIRQLFE